MLVVRLQLWLQALSGIFGTPGTGPAGLALWSERYVFCVHPRGLLSRACPTAQCLSPGSVASHGPPLPPQLFVTLVLCSQATPLLKCLCGAVTPFFFTKVLFFPFFLNPFKSLGRMAQCRERSCVTELRESHSGCICGGVYYPSEEFRFTTGCSHLTSHC